MDLEDKMYDVLFQGYDITLDEFLDKYCIFDSEEIRADYKKSLQKDFDDYIVTRKESEKEWLDTVNKNIENGYSYLNDGLGYIRRILPDGTKENANGGETMTLQKFFTLENGKYILK
jgi:hypothetical protein